MLGTWLEAALLYSLENSGGTLGARGECSTVHEERRSSLKAFCRAQFAKHIFELLLRYYPLRLKGQYSEMVELQLVLLLRQLLFWYTSARIWGFYWSLVLVSWFLVLLQDAIDIARFLWVVLFLVPQTLSASLLDIMACATELVKKMSTQKTLGVKWWAFHNQCDLQAAGNFELCFLVAYIRHPSRNEPRRKGTSTFEKTHVHWYIWWPNLCSLHFGKLQTVGQIWHKGQLSLIAAMITPREWR